MNYQTIIQLLTEEIEDSLNTDISQATGKKRNIELI